MLPDEPVPTTIQNKLGKVFLIDAHAYHGNSGSPIFVNLGGIHGNNFAGDSYAWLGVVSGYYPEYDDGSVSAVRILTGAVRDNSGVSVVVPSDLLLDLLQTPELQQKRDEGIRKYLGQQKPK
jgi:hypothetical protein